MSDNLYYKNDNKKILLLASNKRDLDDMRNALLNADQVLEDRIVGEFKCENALKRIVEYSFPIQFICTRNGKKECIAQHIYNLILRKKDRNNLQVEIVENFGINIISRERIIVFDSRERLVKIKNAHLRDEGSMEIIVNTLFKIPPVYISYGNDKDTKEIVTGIKNKFQSVFPHINIIHDKDNRYKESISSYIGNLVKGKNIILLINRKYLESIHCMKEFVEIFSNSESLPQLRQKIYPIVAESATCVYEPDQMAIVESFWKEERERVKNAKLLSNDPAIDEKKDTIDLIIKILPEFARIIKDFYSLPLKFYQENDFFDLLWEINEQLSKDGFVSFYSNEYEMRDALEFTGRKNQ